MWLFIQQSFSFLVVMSILLRREKKKKNQSGPKFVLKILTEINNEMWQLFNPSSKTSNQMKDIQKLVNNK